MRSGRLGKSVEAKLEKARARGEKVLPSPREKRAPGPAGRQAGGLASEPARWLAGGSSGPSPPADSPHPLHGSPRPRRPARRPARRPGLPLRSRLPWREGSAELGEPQERRRSPQPLARTPPPPPPPRAGRAQSPRPRRWPPDPEAPGKSPHRAAQPLHRTVPRQAAPALAGALPPARPRFRRRTPGRRSSWCSHPGSCESEGPAGERSPRGPAGPAALWTGHGSRVGAGESWLWAPLAQSPGRCPASKAVGGQGRGHRLSPPTCVDLPNKFHLVISLRQRRALPDSAQSRMEGLKGSGGSPRSPELGLRWRVSALWSSRAGSWQDATRRNATLPDRGARCSSGGSLKNQQPATGYEELAPEFVEIPSAFLRCQRQVPCICSSNKVLFVDGLTGLQTQRWEANGETDQGPSSTSGGSLDECLGR
uniref:translation initiation factor IF-2-like n=1 Tax=Callithrix jacchus TaxID=9483 RepID=UPI0023DD039D|nr:translation initiation factor IF-2-like [Callithrix jacchus]